MKSLSEKIIPCDADVIISDHTLLKTEDVKKHTQNAQRRLKEINKLKFPLGCNTNLRNATTTCGDISFGNRIILCDNCVKKLIDKFEENEKETDKIFKEEFGEKLIK